MAIEGTYGGSCTARAGNWAVALNGYQLIAGETALTVVQNDPNCTLSVTMVKAGAVGSPLTYQPVTPFQLAANYAVLGVAFLQNGVGATQFYANFEMTPDLSYANNFVIQMVYSDLLSQTNLSTNATYQVVVATATAGVVPAPNATMSLAALVVTVDAHNIVKTATGTIALTEGTVPGVAYVIDLDTVGLTPTYAAIDTVFNSGTGTHVAIAGNSQNIQAAELNLIGVDLTTAKRRNVILDSVANGIKSYQLFQITINHP